MRRSLTGPVVGLYAFKAVLVGAIFLVLLLSLFRLQSDSAASRRTTQALIDSLTIERSVVDLETGVRGYLLTGRRSFLEPYRAASTSLPGQLRALAATADERLELLRIQTIRHGVASYVSGYARPLVRHGRRLRRGALARAMTRGKALSDRMRSRFAALERTVLADRTQRRSKAKAGVTRAIVLAGIGLGVSLLLEIGVAGFVLRGILRPMRAVARGAARLARGQLSTRVPESGRGEVAQLGESFNQMAASIEVRTGELAAAQRRLVQAVDAAEEASAMKSNFVANMSHEIRTPLNGVLGMLTLLSETELSAEQRKYVDVAMSSSDALMTVVGDVLDIAKIEAGRLELENADFDLHDAVEAVCELMAAAARTKRLELQAFVHESVPRAVRGDRTRVTQVLQNLVSNAIKFTHDGEVVVEVGVVAGSQGPRGRVVVEFAVHDSGIGIEPERVQRLFEPFTQAEAGTTRKFGGTGLGLTISRELTRLMGGDIIAASRPGHGSTFKFRIPFEPARATLARPVPAASLRGLRVLVVDDNATNRHVFQDYVATWGMRAIATAGSHDALTALRDASQAGDPFRIVLLDQNLDGESGLELARDITASPSLSVAHLILLTSSVSPGASDPAAGIRAQLTKPVRQARLLEAITAAMALGKDRKGETEEETPSQRARRHAGRAPARILVAEDHEVNRMLIERMLQNRGHNVEHASDGQSALELLTAADFDLVFMDCQMPRLDGYDATRELRRGERRDGRRRLPVVAMTANAMAGARDRCLEAGMDDYLSKPVSADELDRMLDRWLPVRPAVAAGSDGGVPKPARGLDGVPESARGVAGVPEIGEPPAETDDSHPTPTPTPTSTPTPTVELDPARIDELRTLFPGDEMLKVLGKLCDEVTADLDLLETAFADRDPAVTAAAAHRIRNTGRVIGARPLVDAAAELDVPPRPDQPAPEFDTAAVARLRDAWVAAEAAIEAELAGGRARAG